MLDAQKFVETTMATGKVDPSYANWQMKKWIAEVPELANLKALVLAQIEKNKLATPAK